MNPLMSFASKSRKSFGKMNLESTTTRRSVCWRSETTGRPARTGRTTRETTGWVIATHIVVIVAIVWRPAASAEIWRPGETHLLYKPTR